MTENTAPSDAGSFGDVVGRGLFAGTQRKPRRRRRTRLFGHRPVAGRGCEGHFSQFVPTMGNTWGRFLLSDIFLQRAGMATSTALPIGPERVIPDIYINSVATSERELTPGLFVKTHEGFDRLKKRIPATELRRCRRIYVIRSPEDALVSFYYYHLRQERLRNKVRRGKDAFCRARVRDWKLNAGAMCARSKRGRRCFLCPMKI